MLIVRTLTMALLILFTGVAHANLITLEIAVDHDGPVNVEGDITSGRITALLEFEAPLVDAAGPVTTGTRTYTGIGTYSFLITGGERDGDTGSGTLDMEISDQSGQDLVRFDAQSFDFGVFLSNSSADLFSILDGPSLVEPFPDLAALSYETVFVYVVPPDPFVFNPFGVTENEFSTNPSIQSISSSVPGPESGLGLLAGLVVLGIRSGRWVERRTSS